MVIVLIVMLLLVFLAFIHMAVVFMTSLIVVVKVAYTLLGQSLTCGTPFFDEAVNVCGVSGRKALGLLMVIHVVMMVV